MPSLSARRSTTLSLAVCLTLVVLPLALGQNTSTPTTSECSTVSIAQQAPQEPSLKQNNETFERLDDAEDDDSITEKSTGVMMGLVYGPSFDSLKKQIGSKGSDEIDWFVVRRESLILSEMLVRLDALPDEMGLNEEELKSAKEFNERVKLKEVIAHAQKIYRSSEKKNVEVAKREFMLMTESCNICHKGRASSWAPVTLKH